MVVVRQDFQNPVASHSRHGYAVHKAVTLVTALLVQTQPRQRGFTRLRMNRHATVFQDRSDRLGCHFPQVRAALSQAVKRFSQHLVGRDEADISKRLPRTDDLRAVLIEWMQYCTPIERVRKDQPHFFFGAP